MSQFKKYLEIVQEGLIETNELKSKKGILVLFYNGKTYSANEEITDNDTIQKVLENFAKTIGINQLELVDSDSLSVMAAKQGKFDAEGKPDPYQLGFVRNYSKIEVVGPKGMGIFQFLK